MKRSRLTIGFLFLVLLTHSAFMHLLNNGQTRALNTIRDIRPGLSEEEVLEVAGEELNEFPAEEAPDWIVQLLGDKTDGKYWHYLMLLPPRNLIIYFNDDGVVEFVTWDAT